MRINCCPHNGSAQKIQQLRIQSQWILRIFFGLLAQPVNGGHAIMPKSSNLLSNDRDACVCRSGQTVPKWELSRYEGMYMGRSEADF
jgi:hypothetical protein